ncbi:ImpA family type VI secretion system protein [Labrys sp. KB_33_2]|uniref:type VI secretion system protein TssA n=1 Tax=unclassified Labrys (in: a-proteobacteria) TaxID=2688601 RepID=UPI003EBA120A
MAVYAGIENEISADTPCGPDPDADADAQNFLSVAEGQLPASYRSFNRKSFESKQTLADLRTHLEKSRDLRYLILAAKYHILSDDLSGFVDAIAASNALLVAQWDHCHPTQAAGGAELRSAFLKSLDDLPTVVLPLQSATLINDKRLGAVSIRSVLVGEGKLPAREGETVIESSSIKDAFLRFEPLQQLVDLSASLETVLASLESLRQLFIDKAGHEAAPQFEQLPDLVRAIRAYVDGIVTTREPGLAPAAPTETESRPESADAAAPPPAPFAPSNVASVKEASNALAAILTYYAGKEPSSPARLLLKQAHQLVGKSFVEVMKILAPGLVEKAKIQIGGTMPFALSFAQLSALAVEDGKPDETEAEARIYTVATRGEATALMRQIEIFYNNIEPSSPIPMLIEKARTLVAKDFNALLMEISRKDEK